MRFILFFCASLGMLGAADLAQDVTFRATFDGSMNGSAGKGDLKVYSTASYKEQDKAQPGLAGTDVEWVPSGGKKGGALRFKKKNNKAVFFRAAENVNFQAKSWTGTISFWLSLDPETDLEPGYCDPIQVTDKAYNDSAIWVDFTKDDRPRHFRLGVFGELKGWNTAGQTTGVNPLFENRLVVVKQPPFTRDAWTHVAITHTALGSGKGAATLYVNGEAAGTTPAIAERFAWDPALAAIRLGVNYTGLMDDVMVFSRALTAAEVKALGR